VSVGQNQGVQPFRVSKRVSRIAQAVSMVQAVQTLCPLRHIANGEVKFSGLCPKLRQIVAEFVFLNHPASRQPLREKPVFIAI
jgi:hypothetical protein